MSPACFLASHGVYERGDMPPCTGRLVRAHLLPVQLLKRNGLADKAPDPRAWVPACGGVCGDSGHHGAFDTARTLRVPRSAIPADTEQFAAELGLTWFLDREYGSLTEAAA